jgi:hypothetical protein
LYLHLDFIFLLFDRQCDLAVDACHTHLVDQLILHLFSLLLLLCQLLISLPPECIGLLHSPPNVRLDVVYQVLVHCLVYLDLKINVI